MSDDASSARGFADSQVEIVPYRDSLAGAFADLNYEWIGKDYLIEDRDREILESPREHIIEPGGQIFFALIDGRAVGTAALEAHSAAGFELVKMAVSPRFRGLRIGERLLRECIRYAAGHGKSEITLDSNTKQAAAIALYRKFGFQEVPLDPDSPYTRVNIRMRLALPPITM